MYNSYTLYRMVKIVVNRLEWDEYNIAHIARHKITPEEVQEVCDSEPVERKGHKGRIFLIGTTKKGRMLTVILNPTDQEALYRPITAYDASKTSIQEYQEEKNRGGEAA
jgi:uncharacterized protein